MRIAIAAFLGLASVSNAETDLGGPSGVFRAASNVGQRLLSMARKLGGGGDSWSQYMQNMQSYKNSVNQQNPYYEEGQDDNSNRYYQNWRNNYYGGYGDNANNQRWYGNGDENDADGSYNSNSNYAFATNTFGQTSWMGDYSVKFDGCASDTAYVNGVPTSELMAKFKLCPTNSIRCRRAGEYIIPMSDFVSAMQHAIASDKNCRVQQQKCYSQCQQEARYGSVYKTDNNGAGRRRLGNNGYGYTNTHTYRNYENSNNNNNNNNDRNGNGNNWNYNSRYGNNQNNQNRNGNYDAESLSDWWQEQMEEWSQQMAEKYQEGDQQKSYYNYNTGSDYSRYNGGNNAVAQHNGQYDANSYVNYNAAQQQMYQQYTDETSNYEENNYYYNRDNQDWHNQESYYGQYYEDYDDQVTTEYQNQYYGQDYNNYFDEDYCRYDCMSTAGMAYCNENTQENGANGYNELNLAQMAQCHQLEYYSSESKPYYVGAVCRDGGVYLDIFTDSSCTQAAPAHTHENVVGYSLPDQSLVNYDQLSCLGTQTLVPNYNYQNYQNDEDQEYAEEQTMTAANLCDVLYQDSGKCESKMKIKNKNTAGCDYIHSFSKGALNWIHYSIFVVLGSCLLLAAYICYSKVHRDDAIESAKAVQDKIASFMGGSQKSLKESLTRAHEKDKDDASTINSVDTKSYMIPEIPQIPQGEPMTTDPIVQVPPQALAAASEPPPKQQDSIV